MRKVFLLFLPAILKLFPGTYVTKIIATDKDDSEEDYGKVEYSLVSSNGNGAPKFRIDAVTGEVYTLTQNLDREAQDTYYLKVMVSKTV